MLQALLIHGFCEDRVGLTEGIDLIDQVDVQFPYVHGELADAIDKRGIGDLLINPNP